MNWLRKYTRPIWFWPIALVCSAVSFPAMPFRDRALPELPPSERVNWEEGTFFHNMKNVTTEMYRADAMWWSKFSLFVLLILGLITVF